MSERSALARSNADLPDAVMVALRARPFQILAPRPQAAPLVLASPHSGRSYPASFLRQSQLSALNLRRSEDAFVDELFWNACAEGIPMLIARFPRALLDANRSPGELDASMFDGPLATAVDPVGPRVCAGLGVIPRIVRDGAEIYRSKLPACEAVDRLALFYRPYHDALARLIETTRTQFGAAVLLDCHSMPSAAAVPDIVLGDRYGISAVPALTRAAEHAFGALGFRVVRNVPYAGGYATQLYGRPLRGVHALQIEVNRGLYLDEDSIEPRPEFGEVAHRIAGAVRHFLGYVHRLHGSAIDAQAAE